MEKIQLDIVGLSYSQTQSGAYALVLGESGGKRKLPIIIGGFEAQAIAIELEKMKPSRPLTHDLFKALSELFHITVQEVIIYNLTEGVFFSKLICTDGIKEMEIDARTSDAVALAVRFNCPIYTYEFILSSAGILMDEELEAEESVETEEEGEEEMEIDIEELQAAAKDPSKLSTTDLERMLSEAITKEDYEKASKLRDEINKRKAN